MITLLFPQETRECHPKRKRQAKEIPSRAESRLKHDKLCVNEEDAISRSVRPAEAMQRLKQEYVTVARRGYEGGSSKPGVGGNVRPIDAQPLSCGGRDGVAQGADGGQAGPRGHE